MYSITVIICPHVQQIYSCNASNTEKLRVSWDVGRCKGEQRANTHTHKHTVACLMKLQQMIYFRVSSPKLVQIYQKTYFHTYL